MLSKECFTIEWINQVREANPPADPTIVEKTIYAFELLSLLVKYELKFIFKGGTSLLLLLENPQRLSIDIDISTSVSEEDIKNILNEIAKDSIFTKSEENPRTASNIPKKHYKLFFDSVVNPTHNSYILLDVLFQDDPYPKTVKSLITNKFINTDKEISCLIPTAESLLGDKLTAFAPHTTGIPFGIGKSMQIQKQLFDIGSLFNLVADINEIEESFNNFVSIEAGYRKKEIRPNDVIKDIISTSFLLSQILMKRSIINEETRELQAGITKLRSHLIGVTSNLESAKLNAAKTAFLVSSFGDKDNFPSNKIFELDKIKNVFIDGEYKILEKLKTMLPEAYYYWQKVDEIKYT